MKAGAPFSLGLGLSAGLLALVGGCAQPADLESVPNPVPVIGSVLPAVLLQGDTDVVVEVRGLGFLEGSVATWNGSVVPTLTRDSTLLELTIPVVTGAGGDSAQLLVDNPEPGGGASAAFPLPVGYPVPSVTSVSASDSTAVLASSVLLVVLGSGFASGTSPAQVVWGGVEIPTTVVSSTRIEAVLPDYLLRRGTEVAITVRNPPPGGGSSSPFPFVTSNPPAQVLALDPAGLRVGQGGTFRIRGIGFASGVTVTVDGALLQPILESDSVLRMTLPGQLAVRGDTLAVSVTNPAPGGGASGPTLLPIWEKPPELDRLSTPWAYSNADPFTLRLSGADFAPDATVLWGGVPHGFTFVGGNWLNVPIVPADLAVEGELDVTVVNPREGGASTPLTFTVLPPFSLPDDLVLTETFGGTGMTISRLDGGSAQVFPTPELAFRPDPRPGEDEVVYRRGSRLYHRDLSTNLERPFLDAATSATFTAEDWPRYAPDGAWVYFTADVDGERSVWRARPDGTGAEPIFQALPWFTHWVAPSASGTRISFSDRDLVMYVYDLQTFEVTALPGTFAQIGRWSPDDEWIAYTSPPGLLYVVRSDGSEILGPMPGRYGPVVDWLPDGQRLLAVNASSLAEGVLIEPWLQKVDTLALDSIGSIMLWRND